MEVVEEERAGRREVRNDMVGICTRVRDWVWVGRLKVVWMGDESGAVFDSVVEVATRFRGG